MITGFDRTYLGVHFYNQVLLGYSYSAFLASLLMRPFIDEFINKLAKNLKNVAISNIIAAVYLAVSICIYNFRDPSWDESWDVNYRQNCDHKLLLENALYKNLSETTLIFLIAGLLLGYYKLRDVPIYKFSYKVLFIAASLTSLLGLSVFGMEKLISFISNKPLKMLLISVDRYTGGYVLGYFIPLLIYKLVKPRVPALILSEDLKVELIKINNKS